MIFNYYKKKIEEKNEKHTNNLNEISKKNPNLNQMDFLLKKFSEMEKNGKENNERISNLEIRNIKMTIEIDKLKSIQKNSKNLIKELTNENIKLKDQKENEIKNLKKNLKIIEEKYFKINKEFQKLENLNYNQNIQIN